MDQNNLTQCWLKKVITFSKFRWLWTYNSGIEWYINIPIGNEHPSIQGNLVMTSEYVHRPSVQTFREGEGRHFFLPFSTRSLPHRFFVRPLSVFRAASPLTLRTMTTKGKHTTKPLATQATFVVMLRSFTSSLSRDINETNSKLWCLCKFLVLLIKLFLFSLLRCRRFHCW